MNIKKLLEGKDNLKEQLCMNFLKTVIFDDLLKTKRNSALQNFSMSETEIVAYFDSIGNMNVQVSTVFYPSGKLFELEIFDKKGNSIYECGEEFETRKEAYIRAAEKLIELSN